MNPHFWSREIQHWSTVRFARRLCRAMFNWRTARRATLALAALFTLIAAFYAVENWRGHRAWEQLKREMAANGEPLDLAALLPPPVPDAENFAMAPLWRELLGDDYREAKVATAEWMHMFSYNSHRPSVPPADWRKGERTDLASWQEYFREVKSNASGVADTDVFPTPDRPGVPAADVLLALSRFDRQLAELREAARRPRSRFPLRYEDGMNMTLPHLQYLQLATALLRLRALSELDLGLGGDALADLQLGFRMMGAVENEPTMISGLVRISMIEAMLPTIWQGTVDHRWTDAQVAALEGQLRKLDFLAEYERAFRAETIFDAQTMDTLCANRDGHLIFGGMYGTNERSTVWEKVFRWMPSGWFEQNKITQIRQMRELTLLRAQPSAEYIDMPRWKERTAKVEVNLSSRTPYNYLAGWFGGYGQLSMRTAEAIAHIRLARTALALERHRLAHGEFPESLGVLAPAFIDAVPRDVIDGGELKYRRDASGGFVLYSLGWNGADDGGTVALFKNIGVDRKQGDWVWLSAAQ